MAVSLINLFKANSLHFFDRAMRAPILLVLKPVNSSRPRLSLDKKGFNSSLSSTRKSGLTILSMITPASFSSTSTILSTDEVDGRCFNSAIF